MDWYQSVRFQSALPRGERQKIIPCRSRGYDFNPRSREGSDILCTPDADKRCISIRAPARGATQMAGMMYKEQAISIRAPARGATRMTVKEVFDLVFQSALPRGERHVGNGLSGLQRIFQSALPRGERPCTVAPMITTPGFQSALPRGERLETQSYTGIRGTISIRAPARGATNIERKIDSVNTDFNPRSREGSDGVFTLNWKQAWISIRAPARGATKPSTSTLRCLRISIRAPARGATSIFAKKFSSFLAKIV